METSHLLKEERALHKHFDKCTVGCIVRRGQKYSFQRRADQKQVPLDFF